MRSLLLVVLLLGGVAAPVGGALAASAPRPGGIGIRLIAGAGRLPDSPLARVYVVGRLAPGASTERRVEISNDTSSTAEVSVYPAAARLRRGNFAFASAHGQNALSRWTSVGRDVVRVPSGTIALETLRIDVPGNAAAGEHYAVVWAEVSAPALGGVTLVNRVGIRIYLTVGSGGTVPANFAIGAVTAARSSTGAPLVVATIRNTGARTLDISGFVTLSAGPGGLRAGPFPLKLNTALAPKRSHRAIVQLDKRLPRGPWRARVELRSDTLERTAVATIRFPRSARAARPAAGSAMSRTALALVLAMLVLIAAGAGVFLRSRRR